MSATLRRPVLHLDDPLDTAPTRTARRDQAAAAASEPSAAAAPPSTQPEPKPPADPPSRPPRRAHKRAAPAERTAAAGERVSTEWRAWSGASRVASFRLPDELLDELEQRAGQLGVPLGMTVATGLLHLFDQDDETVLALVDRAEATRDQARRQARRRTPTLRARTS
jgi:hypothetical protein